MQWYYAQGQERVGPVSDEEFSALVTTGTVTATTLVWHEGMENWVAYGAVADVPAVVEPAAEELNILTQMNTSNAEARAEVSSAESRGTGGATPNGDITAHAKAALSGYWAMAIGILVVYNVISLAVSMAGQFVPIVGPLLPTVIAGPLAVGINVFFLSLVRGNDPDFAMMFDGFKCFVPALLTNLLMALYILLWALLLIIPGIIASYAYAMAFYIVADEPTIGPGEALRRSKEMMQGNKFKLFCLYLHFFGWAMLCILTLGIGFLWLAPYMSASMARFYEDVR
jgi:uncharacterized membrane protein